MKIKNNKNISKRGFTLFELLVSISIIAILTAVAVVSYGGLNKKTRDSRRIADVEKVRIALEAARQIGNTYPSSLDNLVAGGYLDKEPIDPKNNKYSYAYTVATNTYRICAFMEDVGSTSADVTNCSGMPGGYGYIGYYKVVNP